MEAKIEVPVGDSQYGAFHKQAGVSGRLKL